MRPTLRRTVGLLALSNGVLGGCGVDARDVRVLDEDNGLGSSGAGATPPRGAGEEGPAVDTPMDGPTGMLGGGVASMTRFDFGSLEVQGDASGTTWTVTNGATVSTSVPSLVNDNPNELLIQTNRCTAALAPGASCSIDLSFRPAAGGARSAALTLTASPGGSALFQAVANGQYRLTVVNSSEGGTGIVDAPATQLDCGATCSVLVDEGARVTLQARTSNESGVFFTGWSGAGCAGPFRDCELIVGGPTTVTARFAPRLNNLIFATSTLLSTDLGSFRPYDRECNLLASAAGINDTAGNAYVAALTDSVSAFPTRLGASARGWVRRDGAPFADTKEELFSERAALNAVAFDENGRDVRAEQVITGSLTDGTLSSDGTCLDWTSTTGGSAGTTLGAGAGHWITGFVVTCGRQRVICMGRTRTVPLAFSGGGDRTIWVSSSAYRVGAGQTPDEQCQAERPPGVVNARALIATTQRAASSLLDPDATYARPDGIRVGTGAQLARGVALDSGIWQTADLVYGTDDRVGLIFTGQTDLNRIGTAGSTCSDWADPSGAGALLGLHWSALANWWAYAPFPCSSVASVYCVSVP